MCPFYEIPPGPFTDPGIQSPVAVEHKQPIGFDVELVIESDESLDSGEVVVNARHQIAVMVGVRLNVGHRSGIHGK